MLKDNNCFGNTFVANDGFGHGYSIVIESGKGVIPKPMKSGGEFSRGCGAVMPNRRKKTKYA